MGKSISFLTACLIVSLLPVAVFAQAVTIRGTVRNSISKDPVPAVSVIIKGTSEGDYTDDKGNFSLTTTTRLPLTLVFTSAGGYEPKEVNVLDASVNIEVEFNPISTLGEEVVIAATLSSQRILESPVTIERLGSAALRNSPLPNYYEAIANLKGVDMHTASLTFRTVTTRGFVSSGNTRLNQLIDGMDNQAPGLNFAVGNIVGLTELDVDNIELLSGASSALYGSGGMNGTVLITSKNPFKYQGLSFNIKQGIMHVDGKQRNTSPYYDWTMRWAKKITNRLAFKLAGQLLRANDWQADDYRNVSRTGVLSKLVGGNRITDPNYDGVNVYGDETSANMLAVAQSVQNTINAQIPIPGGIVNTLNAIIPPNATIAQRNSIIAATFGGNPALLAAVQQLLPFYWGLRNDWFPNQNVSRTGYEEKYLVDYNSLNFKFTAGLHYKITPGIEVSWNTYWGTGTTVYTGADRYSLRNFKMAQHKLEFKHQNWFIRGYTTQENAGEAYNATVLGRLMQEAFKPSTTWYPTYAGAYEQYMETVYNSGNVPSSANAHAFARSIADAGRPLPGTAQFEQLKKQVRIKPIPSGAKFLDKSDLYALDARLNFSDVLGFSKQLEVIIGGGWKQYVLNSQGTIFADTAGPVKVSEFGGFAQLKRDLGELLTLTAAVRYDKHDNFDGKFTPRFTAVIHATQDHNIRLSYQTAYRFPSNQDQYINLNVGSGILIGFLPEFFDFYNFSTNTPYTAESILAYRFSGNPANTNLLVPAVQKEVKPESVSSGEIGYKGLFNKKFLIDVYAYYSRYKDFLARVAVGQSLNAGPPTDLFNPLTTRNLSYQQTSTTDVKAIGWGLGVEYQLPRNFVFSGNIFSDELRDLEPGLISFFNAPKYRWNLGLRNDNVWKNIGFNVIVKWQDNNFYEGTFVTGTLPYFTWVDAQISYRMPGTKSVFRVGGSNIGNSYYRTGFGSPYVGGLYYVSYGYNIF